VLDIPGGAGKGSDRAKLYFGDGRRRRTGLRGADDQRRLARISAAHVSRLGDTQQ